MGELGLGHPWFVHPCLQGGLVVVVVVLALVAGVVAEAAPVSILVPPSPPFTPSAVLQRGVRSGPAVTVSVPGTPLAHTPSSLQQTVAEKGMGGRWGGWS